MVAFEYFSGLNVTERKEQAKDLLEELLSDFLFYIPALSLANMWSRVSPVYFYLFDYVPIPSQNGNENSEESSTQTVAPLQANHGSDIRFLMNGHNGSALDREISSNMVDFWINFIHKGSPLNSGTDWPQFREETKEFLKIGEEIEPASGFRTRQFQFWSELVPRVNKRVCGSSFPSTGRGTSSLTFGESGRKVQKVLPLIFKDVAEADFSKKFFTSASFLNDEGDDSQNKMKQ